MAQAAQLHFAHADIKGLRKKINKFNRAYWLSMKRLWRDATRAFLRTVVLEGQVHILTGMSAASLIPLAEKAEMRTKIESYVISRGKGAKKQLTRMDGTVDKSRWREIKEGIRAGSKHTRLTFGSETRPFMEFDFGINVYQYALWEDSWQSLESGMVSFVDYIRSQHNTNNYKTKGIKLEDALIPDFYIGAR